MKGAIGLELEMALKEASAIRRVDICIIFDSPCLQIFKKIDMSLIYIK